MLTNCSCACQPRQVLKAHKFSSAYFPVSKLWELRDETRLMEAVGESQLKKVSSGSFVICQGQNSGWRRRETNLMQLMTLLRRTCSLEQVTPAHLPLLQSASIGTQLLTCVRRRRSRWKKSGSSLSRLWALGTTR